MADTKTCAKCGKAEAGQGGILCPPCKTAIEQRDHYPEPETPSP